MSTILVVDDMALCREPIAEALRSNGYDVVCAPDGAEVLALLSEDTPDLILLDVNMPQMDSLAVLETIRKNPRMRQIPVVLLTDRGAKEDVVKAVKHGVQVYLLKSQVSLDDVLGRIGVCLGQRALVETRASADGQTNYANWRAKEAQAEDAYQTSSRERNTSSPPNRMAKLRPPATLGSAGTLDSVRSIGDLTPVITKSDLTRLVNKGLDLRPLGPTVHGVIAVTGSAGCCADDVAKAIAHDQMLCIRILKLANSSAYSRGRLVSSVKEAVSRIGVQEIRSLVMALGVFEQFEGASAEHVDVRLFWEHSIACGLAASAIAQARGSERIENSCLWGMVHDVGRLILLEHVSDQYASVWKAAEKLTLPLESIEAKMMLLDHCDILGLALERWQFPREFIAPVVNHHRSIHAIKRLRPSERDGAAIVALANRLAHALLLGSSGNEVVYPLDDLVEMLGLAPSQVTKLAATIPSEANGLKAVMLSHASDCNWPDLIADLKQQLTRAFRPLCVSMEPDIDAYRMFCERIAHWDGEGQPTVGIMYLREAAELPALAAAFDSAECKHGLTSMPVILICGKGQVDAGSAWVRARCHVLLKTPVPMTRILTAVEEVLA